MDVGKAIERARNILTTPRTEWAAIGAEGTTAASVPDLYKGYIAILAAIPAVALFVKGTVIGYGALGITVRNSLGAGLTSMVLHYLLSLALAYVMALVVNALAPTFGGQKDTAQALRAVAYAWTASWVAAIATIVPWLGFLVALAGGIYSIYLLYLGLPHTMKCPPARAGAYTAVSIVIAVVLSWVLGMVVAGIAGTGAVLSGAGGRAAVERSRDVHVDEDSSLGELQAWSEKMDAAGKQLGELDLSGFEALRGRGVQRN